MAAAILVVLVLLLAGAVRASHSGEVLPGVQVEGVALGGMSKNEARQRLESIADEASRAPVTLVAEDRRLTLKPSKAGYFADAGATAQAALESGRSGPLGGLPSTIAGLFADRDVELEQRIDRDQLERVVGSLTDELGRRSFPGELVIDPETLEVSINQPRSGREVDSGRFAERLERALERRPRGIVQVPLEMVKVVRIADVERVAKQARAYLREPLTLTGAGRPLEVSPSQLGGVIALESRDDGKVVRLGAGDKRVAALVEDLAPKRDRAARDASLSAPARGAATLDAKGPVAWRPRSADVKVRREARPGRMVLRDKLAGSIESAIRAGEHRAKLPVKRIEPTLSAADAKSVTSLIGTFTTYYTPGQPRVTNITQMAREVDRTIVAPGARFSLNETVGQRTEAGGYVEAPFISDGELVPSVGGGVSQFSTTMYNAAYFAGLQLNSHQPHSFFIDRYPAGREATLNFPNIDLTWTNDTKAAVFVRTSTDANSVSVSLYGDNGGRRVKASNGERMPLPGRDFSLVVTREVRYPGGKVAEDSFMTRYDNPPAE
ncbi:MAG: VanW family protein [Solirubrobacteraceae bacterium]